MSGKWAVHRCGSSRLRRQNIFLEWHMIGYAVSVAEAEDGPEWLFVEAEDARERYAIPAAFARYAQYMNIPVGITEEDFAPQQSAGGSGNG